MKFYRLGAVTALLATAGLIGCSSDQNQPKGAEHGASIGFHLATTNGVVITSANYDLNTQAGADVVDGSIPVPNDDSTITLGIQNLGAGSYALAFSATGTYQGHSVPCVSAPQSFSLATNQHLTLPTITLTCTVTNQVDTSASVDANVTVAVDTITVGSVIETFTYGPRSVTGHLVSNVCSYPPVALKVANSNAAVHYSWAAAPDGTLALNASSTLGTYTCTSGGDKTLTLTGTDGTTTSTKSVTVHCDSSVCDANIVCGNGIVESGEQCDEATPRCTNCRITPVCGDGITDAPEACDTAGPSATCDGNCHIIVPPRCGDGHVDAGEQCDAGSANSDTAANACRTNCHLPSCGDGVADTGEGCDSGAANSNSTPNACRTNCQPAHCGDGIVDAGEQCDAAILPTATCDATCHTIAVVPVCGNGTVESGEQCDTGAALSSTCTGTQPPVSTEGNCQTRPHPGCFTCINASADLGPFNASYCTTAQCTNVQNCVVDAGCFNPIAARCLCGLGATDIDNCGQSTFTQTGPCASVIHAGNGWASNADNQASLDRLFDTGFQAGVGMAVLDEASRQCPTQCF